MNRGSISHSLIKTIIGVAENRGADRASLLACISVSEEVLQDALSRAPLEKVITLFQLIIEQTGDQAIGLHVAEEIRPGSLSALGYAMMSCRNSQQAIELQKSFGGLIADCAALNLVKDDKYGHATFTVKDDDFELVRPINDMFIAIFWVYGKWITRVDAELQVLVLHIYRQLT